MKTLTLIILSTLLFLGCNPASKNDLTSIFNQENSTEKSSSTQPNQTYWEELVMKQILDDKGTMLAEMPMPNSWEFNKDGVMISGPNNIRVTSFAPQVFMMNYDPSLAYAYSQTPMRELPSIDELIQQDIIPAAQKRGYKYIKHYELPEIAKGLKWYDEQLFKVGQTQTTIQSFGVDFEDKNGNPVLYLLDLSSSKSQGFMSWYYLGTMLNADPDVFELAKKQYIFALSNKRYNLIPIQQYNEAEANRIGQSWAAFNKRMAANQAAFEAQQAAHINKTNAVNDAIMGAYNSRMASMDKMQEQTIDGIYERQNVQNPETGQVHKVEQGYNRYWMNNNGEYIATPQQNFDPNTVQGLNETNWQELNKVK